MAAECAICSGTGYALREDTGGVLTSVRCACEIGRRGKRLLQASRIPERYAHCSFDSEGEHSRGFEIHDPSHETALGICRRWAEAFPGEPEDPGLMLVGPPGLGKTHLVISVARYLMEHKGVRVLFYEQRALLKALQGTFETGSGRQESDVFRPVLDCELLVLDDLGAGRTTEWAKDVLHDVISHRYNARKPILITTNVTLAAPDEKRAGRSVDAPLTLADRLGVALISRLHEMCRIVTLGGKDYRTGVLAQQRFS